MAEKEYAKISENKSLTNIEKCKQFDFDWFLRFFDSVGNVSNEDMQGLWAKALAREIDESGSFSLRTIEVLKNMSRKECLILQKTTPFILSGGNEIGHLVLWDDMDLVNNKGYLTKEELLLLYDIGLLSSNYNIWPRKDSTMPRIFLTTMHYGLVENEYKGEYKITVSVFSSTGHELLTIVPKEKDDTKEIYLLRKIKENYSKLNLSLHRIVDDKSGETLFDATPIE